MPEIDTVLFDLDGTLADTGPDMAYALNVLRLEEGHAPLSYSQIRPLVSHGATALIRLGFDIQPDDPGFESLRQRFLHHYQQHLCRDTQLFDGMEKVLQHCEAKDSNLAIDVATVTTQAQQWADRISASDAQQQVVND